MIDPVDLSRQGIEVWKDVPGYEGYQASNLGRVRSVDRYVTYMCRGKEQKNRYKGRVLKQTPHKAGGIHFSVTLGSSGPALVHHVVLSAFVSPKPDGKVTRHLDGNGGNNALYNIVYGTHSQNRKDDVRLGLYDRSLGAPSRRAILTDKQVLEIKRILASGKRGLPEKLAKEYGVNRGTIEAIKYGRNWSHLKLEAA